MSALILLKDQRERVHYFSKRSKHQLKEISLYSIFCGVHESHGAFSVCQRNLRKQLLCSKELYAIRLRIFYESWITAIRECWWSTNWDNKKFDVYVLPSHRSLWSRCIGYCLPILMNLGSSKYRLTYHINIHWVPIVYVNTHLKCTHCSCKFVKNAKINQNCRCI